MNEPNPKPSARVLRAMARWHDDHASALSGVDEAMRRLHFDSAARLRAEAEQVEAP